MSTFSKIRDVQNSLGLQVDRFVILLRSYIFVMWIIVLVTVAYYLNSVRCLGHSSGDVTQAISKNTGDPSGRNTP
jgi:hypothetical protein